NDSDERTSTANPSLAWRNRSSKDDRRLAPMNRVAARKPTPRTMAVPVERRRRRWARSDAKVTVNTSGPQVLHAVEDRLGRRLVQLVDDAPVGEEEDGVGVGGGDRVVGDHRDGLAHLVDGSPQEAQ